MFEWVLHLRILKLKKHKKQKGIVCELHLITVIFHSKLLISVRVKLGEIGVGIPFILMILA